MLLNPSHARAEVADEQAAHDLVADLLPHRQKIGGDGSAQRMHVGLQLCPQPRQIRLRRKLSAQRFQIELGQFVRDSGFGRLSDRPRPIPS